MASTRRSYLRYIGTLGGATVVGASSGCNANGFRSGSVPKVRVGSKPFTEQLILGSLAYVRLQQIDGVEVVNEIGYGDSLANWDATAAGEKDIYWEYTGTAWIRLPPRRDERITDPAELYERVESDARAEGLRMGEPAPFSNGFRLIADREWSDQHGITTISDLFSYATEQTNVGIALGQDFYERADGWTALLDHYGVGSETRSILESDPFFVTSIGITYELVADGRVEVASGFETDPHNARESYIELEDDMGFFIPYQPTPTAYAPTAESLPVFETLSPVAASLDRETMRQLNGQVLFDGERPMAVAQSYLERLREVDEIDA